MSMAAFPLQRLIATDRMACNAKKYTTVLFSEKVSVFLHSVFLLTHFAQF